MQDRYLNLPGQLTEFKDGGLQLRTDPTPPATDSILLLGTATDGPVLEPVAVDPSTVELIFGRSIYANGMPNGATLVQGFEEAYAGGCRDIRLMRISGTPATITLTGADSTSITTKVKTEAFMEPVAGNSAGTVTLGQPIPEEVGSNFVVYADGKRLDLMQVRLPEDGVDRQSLVFVEGVCNVGAPITVVFESEGKTTIITTNDSGEPLLAPGEPQVFDLTLEPNQTPMVENAKMYFNGEEAVVGAFELDVEAKKVTLNTGYGSVGDTVEFAYAYTDEESTTPKLVLTSVFGGSLYNDLRVSVTAEAGEADSIGKVITITKPDSKKASPNELPLTYRTTEHVTFGLLARAINADPENNVVRASVEPEYANFETKSLQATESDRAFLGGNDGIALSKQDLFAILGGGEKSNGVKVDVSVYQMLENYNVDWIVPLGVFADDQLVGKYDDFAYQLALACAVISHRGDTVTGVIAMNSPVRAGFADVNQHVTHLLNKQTNYLMRDRNNSIILDSEGNPFDLGRYIRVIAGPDTNLYSPRLGLYHANSAAYYAGLVSSLPVSSSPTNKAAPNVHSLRYTFSPSQLDKLTGARYITYRVKPNGSIAVTDGLTSAQPGSDYVRETSMRIVKEAVKQIRAASDPFIGEPNDIYQRNALSAAIAKRLDRMKEAGDISDYSFQIIATLQQQVLGLAEIELTIVPRFELRRLTTIVSLRPTL